MPSPRSVQVLPAVMRTLGAGDSSVLIESIVRYLPIMSDDPLRRCLAAIVGTLARHTGAAFPPFVLGLLRAKVGMAGYRSLCLLPSVSLSFCCFYCAY